MRGSARGATSGGRLPRVTRPRGRGLAARSLPDGVTIRTTLRPGDLGAIVRMHGVTYAREYGFDATFEAYVAGPLSEFALRGSPRERLWIAERRGRIVGCVAIVASSQRVAQLRWYLVSAGERGAGLGRRLLALAVAWSRGRGYHSIILWTVGALEAAAHLYRAAGFRRVEEIPGTQWGVPVIEEKYRRILVPRGRSRRPCPSSASK